MVKIDDQKIKRWFCNECKTISMLDINISNEDFKCIKCGNRYLLPIKELK